MEAIAAINQTTAKQMTHGKFDNHILDKHLSWTKYSQNDGKTPYYAENVQHLSCINKFYMYGTYIQG